MIPTLQVAIGPVILISGVGLLLLSMTNRFGRTVDRARELARGERDRVAEQLHVLMSRARLMRTAIISASLSVLFASLLIIVLFVGALLHLDVTAVLVGMLFIACMICLIVSLVLFIGDVNQSLKALKLEIGET